MDFLLMGIRLNINAMSNEPYTVPLFPKLKAEWVLSPVSAYIAKESKTTAINPTKSVLGIFDILEKELCWLRKKINKKQASKSESRFKEPIDHIAFRKYDGPTAASRKLNI